MCDSAQVSMCLCPMQIQKYVDTVTTFKIQLKMLMTLTLTFDPTILEVTCANFDVKLGYNYWNYWQVS